jgi:hypothetical protein
LAGEPLREDIHREVVWKPSREDRRSHPDLPADACVKGRLLVRQVQPNHGGTAFLLPFFTTLPSSVEQVYELYGQRWAIETDLRTLKCTLCLDQLTCATPDMVAKEIEMGITAYNLVRALISLASQQSGIPPRGYRFHEGTPHLASFWSCPGQCARSADGAVGLGSNHDVRSAVQGANVSVLLTREEFGKGVPLSPTAGSDSHAPE